MTSSGPVQLVGSMGCVVHLLFQLWCSIMLQSYVVRSYHPFSSSGEDLCRPSLAEMEQVDGAGVSTRVFLVKMNGFDHQQNYRKYPTYRFIMVIDYSTKLKLFSRGFKAPPLMSVTTPTIDGSRFATEGSPAGSTPTLPFWTDSAHGQVW